MRYNYEKPRHYRKRYGTTYFCNHPVYSKCTLFKISEKGLAIIQQRYISADKHTFWGEIDPWLNDAIFEHPKFPSYFESKAKIPENGLYPTVTVRQVMWALRMKPIPKQPWETVFDHNDI